MPPDSISPGFTGENRFTVLSSKGNGMISGTLNATKRLIGNIIKNRRQGTEDRRQRKSDICLLTSDFCPLGKGVQDEQKLFVYFGIGGRGASG